MSRPQRLCEDSYLEQRLRSGGCLTSVVRLSGAGACGGGLVQRVATTACCWVHQIKNVILRAGTQGGSVGDCCDGARYCQRHLDNVRDKIPCWQCNVVCFFACKECNILQKETLQHAATARPATWQATPRPIRCNSSLAACETQPKTAPHTSASASRTTHVQPGAPPGVSSLPASSEAHGNLCENIYTYDRRTCAH